MGHWPVTITQPTDAELAQAKANWEAEHPLPEGMRQSLRALTTDEMADLFNGGAGLDYPFTPDSTPKTG